MISAVYPKTSVETIVNVIANVANLDGVNDEDMNLLRDFLVSLNNLKKTDGVVILKPGDYARLCDSEDLLQALKGAGVDNWEGYDFALEDYWANKEEE